MSWIVDRLVLATIAALIAVVVSPVTSGVWAAIR